MLLAKKPKVKIFALVSYPFLPAKTGGEISTFQLLQHLGKEHQVKVFTVDPYTPINTNEFSFEILFGMRFKPWRYLNIFLPFLLTKQIKQHNSDIIFLDQPFMGWMIPVLKIFTRKKVFVRCHNIEYLRFKSMGKSWWSFMYMYEKMVHQLADLVIFLSEVDQKHAQYEFNLNPDKTALIPTGINYQETPEPIKNAQENVKKELGIGSNQQIVLYFGTMNYQPNYEGALYVLDEIYPRLLSQLNDNFFILICGKGLPEEIANRIIDKKQFKYLGFVENLDEYIDAADVLLNPIMSGGGVKTKALESLGRGKIVVSTYNGALGIDQSVCEQHLKVASNHQWEEFTQLIIQALKQSYSPMTKQFFETYSWTSIVRKLSRRLSQFQ